MSKNYILNGDARFGTRGAVTYADAVQPRPVDGVGGSPTVTLTTSTTTPIQGNAEFLFTKGAGTAQGQGFSIDFTIDRADQAKPLQISFDWELVSGTFSGSTTPATDSDVIVYIYDVTNAVLIEPAGRLLEPAITGQQYRYRGTFQSSSNSTSYRLIFHVATTSASAYTLGFDDIRVGPQVVSNGAVITDWQSYTPVFTGYTTAPLSPGVMYWRRVGANIELKGFWQGATPTATPITFTLPPGLNINPTALADTSNANVGMAFVSGAASNFFHAHVTFNAPIGTNRLAVGVQTSTISAYAAPPNGTAWASANMFINVQATVPISGWSSNSQISTDTDTRVVSAVVTRSSAAVTANATVANWELPQRDTHGAFNPTTGFYTVPVSGDYQVNLTGLLPNTGSATATIFLNSTGYVASTLSTAGTTRGVVSVVVPNLRAGDTISVRVDVSVTLAADLRLSLHRISGPSQIAASEAVYASARSTVGQVLTNNTDSILNVNIKDYDSHNSLELGASARFTAPVNGVYEAQSMIRFTAGQSFTASNLIAVLLYKNGSLYRQMANVTIQVTNASTGFVSVTGSGEVQLNAGEYIEIRAFQNSGANRTLEANGQVNWISIKKVD